MIQLIIQGLILRPAELFGCRLVFHNWTTAAKVGLRVWCHTHTFEFETKVDGQYELD